MKLSYQKFENLSKVVNYGRLWSISGKYQRIIYIFVFSIFFQNHKVLCGISHGLGCKRIRDIEKLLQISYEDLIPKIRKSLESRELWPIIVNFWQI